MCALLASLALAASAVAGPTANQAKRIYQRLNGTPPSSAVLQQMLAQPDLQGAAGIATNPTYAPGFYNETLKTWVTPWTNRDGTVFAPLNDYTATVIGMVRDDVPFNTALSADILYTVNASGLPAPSAANNNHYATAETNGVDLSTALTQTMQSSTYGLPAAATAGLLTTRGAASAFFLKGTNRAMFRFTMINHLCNDMPTLMDTSRPVDRIRQDVARSPGADSRLYLNSCIGCHSGMDPMAQAFAYYNFDETQQALVYTPGAVQPKYLINSQNFPYGFITPDDSWSNRWRSGTNQWIGWSSSLPGSGNGAKSLGQEIAASDAFATCGVTKVFQAMCYRAPLTAPAGSAPTPDQQEIAALKAAFLSGYKLKSVFQQAVAYCAGS
jgi:hypothetical protein